jgi:hypothetical protein
VRSGAVGAERVVDQARHLVARRQAEVCVGVERVDHLSLSLEHVVDEVAVHGSPVGRLAARLGVEVRLVEDDLTALDGLDRRFELPDRRLGRRA